ncbi:hypothetical protein V6N12_031368 [Hibiscus sabdariffa]|uniref:Agglutinin domain-containing protein n=1 Tax=Hibiscus sabdariffa TaxID=183260 RepID=A0ABR1ZJG5_9ROSI
MASAPILTLPSFIALRFDPKGYYLSYVREGGSIDGYLKFFETQAESPFSKLQVEAAGADGLFHIRSTQNNKYWERSKNLSITGNPAEQYWITATANNKEEDQSKESCTLFKFISVDPAKNTVRIVHVQSGCYLCLWGLANPTYDGCVLANYQIHDHQGCDIFQLVDLKLPIPKIMTFGFIPKGSYLSYVREGGSIDGYLKFFETNVESPYAKFEVELAGVDGSYVLLHIRSLQNNKYWERSKNLSITGNPAEQYWITATADNKEDDQSKESCTLFKSIPIDPATKTVRILHLQSGCYLCLWGLANPTYDGCVLANYQVHDHQGCDIFQVAYLSSGAVEGEHGDGDGMDGKQSDRVEAKGSAVAGRLVNDVAVHAEQAPAGAVLNDNGISHMIMLLQR